MLGEQTSQRAILLVSRIAQNLALLKSLLLKQGYEVLTAITVEEFGASLDSDGSIRLVLDDLTGYDASIWPVCERLREAHTPLLMLAARKSAALDQTGRA